MRQTRVVNSICCENTLQGRMLPSLHISEPLSSLRRKNAMSTKSIYLLRSPVHNCLCGIIQRSKCISHIVNKKNAPPLNLTSYMNYFGLVWFGTLLVDNGNGISPELLRKRACAFYSPFIRCANHKISYVVVSANIRAKQRARIQRV